MISIQKEKPKYGQILESILQGIIKGEWDPGERIPPERALAKEYDASVGTVRVALQHLVNQGYLHRRQGKGTFVSKAVEHYETLRYFRFASDFTDVVQPLTIRCLQAAKLVEAPEEAALLGLEPDQRMYEVRRTFNLASRPVVYVVTYLRSDLLPGLERLSAQTLEELALYVILEAKYSMPTLFTKERFAAITAGGEAASHLQLKEGDPVLKIMLLASTTHQTPYAYQVAYCNTQNLQIYRD